MASFLKAKCYSRTTFYKIKIVALAKNDLILGAPEKSRTPNLQIRSLALYPIELRALNQKTLAIPVESLSTF